MEPSEFIPGEHEAVLKLCLSPQKCTLAWITGSPCLGSITLSYQNPQEFHIPVCVLRKKPGIWKNKYFIFQFSIRQNCQQTNSRASKQHLLTWFNHNLPLPAPCQEQTVSILLELCCYTNKISTYYLNCIQNIY